MNTTNAGINLLFALVSAALLQLGQATAFGQLPSLQERMLSAEIQNARARLQAQQPGLPEQELSRLAEVAGRSNYLARAIATAVQRNDLTNAARLLQEFPGDINAVAPFGQPLLYNAVQMGNTGTVSFLLAQKADPNQLVPGNQTLLDIAMQYSRWPIALQLIEAGASATRTNLWGQTPLARLLNSLYGRTQRPADDPRSQLLHKLLEQGADAFAPAGSGDTNAIVERLLSRRDELFGDLLLTNRPSPLRRTPDGNTALHLAAVYGRTNALEFLLSAGFAVDQTNADGLTPLQLIAPSVRPTNPPGRLLGPGRVISITSQGQFRQPYLSGFQMSGPFGPGRSTAAEEVAELLLRRGAQLDVFCAAALGRTNELKALLLAEPARVQARDGLGRTALHYAVEAHRFSAARLLLQSGADPSASTTKAIPTPEWRGLLRFGRAAPSSGSTPLHLAVEQSQADLVELLLRAKAAVTLADSAGNTPLHLAARDWSTNSTALLAAAHAPLNATNREGKTPLRLAVESGQAPNVELLLNLGALPKVGLTNETLMHIAAERNALTVVQALYRHGLALEPRDGNGRTPFARAAAACPWDVLNWLRNKGVDPNAADTNGDTALHLLSPKQYEMVGHNLEQSASDRLKQQWLSQPGVRQQFLQKLITWKVLAPPQPIRWTNSSLTAWLLEHGAKPNATNRLGQTPLYTLCGQQWMTYADTAATNRIADLLKAGARPDLADTHGVTPLHVAASNAAPAVLSLLLQALPRPGALRDAAGHSPLYYAAARRENGRACLTLLLAAGLDPNEADAQGRSLLHRAVETYDNSSGWQVNELLTMLLTNKANPNLQDKQGLTPLHLAVLNWGKRSYYAGQDPCLMLLTNHADLNLRNREGKTPLHLLVALPNLGMLPGGTYERLLALKGDFTVRDNAGQTALHLWASNSVGSSTWNTLMQTVLTNQSLLRLTNSAGDLPLHVAIRAGNYNALKVLLDAGADPMLRNARGESGWRLAVALAPGNTPEQLVRPPGVTLGFFDAIRLRNQAALDLWLKADPSLCSVTNVFGQTPLMVATETGRDRGLEQKLLQLGAPLDLMSAMRLGRWEDFHKLLPGTHGVIPPDCLFEAVRLGRPDAVRDLVNAGGAPQAVDAEGHSLLYRAAVAGQTNLVDWLQGHNAQETLFDALARGNLAPVESYLNANPALVNTTNALGRTPLLAASAAGQPALVSLLLARGARLDACTRERWTALHIAAANDFTQVVEILLRAGADPNQLAIMGLGPLHLAAAYNASETTALLLEHGAQVNLQAPVGTGDRNTPLHWAAHRGSFDTAKILLAHGAELEARNVRNETPADLVATATRRMFFGFASPPEAPRLKIGLRWEADGKQMLQLLEEAKAHKNSGSKPAELPR